MPGVDPGSYRIGVDIGGTFTDVVLIDHDGNIATRKVPSTPDDYGRAIVEAIGALVDECRLDRADCREIVHGTTVATNAILERKGARAGLLTTRGFRDTLEIGRLRYPRMYDLTWSKPTPLIERRWRLEITERLDRSGAVVEPLDLEQARTAIRRLLDEGIESLAICLLHGYVNPAHELILRDIVAEIAPALPVSLASEVLPEIGEYERTSTTTINAYLQPVVGRYLASLADGLSRTEIHAPVRMMQSNGGIMSAAAASERPIHIVESGPAAGVIAARALAEQGALANLITLDMGGTTAKASIVDQGKLHYATECEVGAGLNVGNRLNRGAGYLLRVPAIDIAEVGAGGGSIIWLDSAGALHVGPQSAGAAPGPVCYLAGGTQPTLTDANLILGYLNPTALLGGALPIDRARALAVFDREIARPLGLETVEAAHGVHRIGVATMVRVVRAVSSERGRDPRGYTLVAFGGNGPVHAALVAAELGIPRVVIPPRPGLFSAVGLLAADVTHHFSRTILRPTSTLSTGELDQAFRELEARAVTSLSRDGYVADQFHFARAVDARYVGQSFELRIPVDRGTFTAADLFELENRFGDEHERTYGHRADGDPIELVHLRVTATIPSERASPATSLGLDGAVQTALPPAPFHQVDKGNLHGGNAEVLRGDDVVGLTSINRRQAYFGRAYGVLETPVVDRPIVGSEPSNGPLIVEEYDATTVVPPGWRVWRDAADNLILEPRGKE